MTFSQEFSEDKFIVDSLSFNVKPRGVLSQQWQTEPFILPNAATENSWLWLAENVYKGVWLVGRVLSKTERNKINFQFMAHK